MIHKNIEYGFCKDVTVAEFGKGTLAITDGENDIEGSYSLLIKTNKHIPIGEVSGNEKNSDEFKPELVILFTSKESFDVFFEYVKNIKDKYEYKKQYQTT